jgi:hypothetical protein
MRARRRRGYICSMTKRRNPMNLAMVERDCGDCPLAAEARRTGEPRLEDARLDPENGPEHQLEQLERSFGTNWKW